MAPRKEAASIAQVHPQCQHGPEQCLVGHRGDVVMGRVRIEAVGLTNMDQPGVEAQPSFRQWAWSVADDLITLWQVFEASRTRFEDIEIPQC